MTKEFEEAEALLKEATSRVKEAAERAREAGERVKYALTQWAKTAQQNLVPEAKAMGRDQIAYERGRRAVGKGQSPDGRADQREQPLAPTVGGSPMTTRANAHSGV